MARILGIGVATLDIVNEVAGYPAEDSELRAISQRQARGGNAANTLTVLSLLGHRCSFAGVLAADLAAGFVRDDLDRHGIELGGCAVAPEGVTPTSCIVMNRVTGSRTIVHFRELREFSFVEFSRLPLHSFQWLHFEGRNVAETRRMLDAVTRQYPDVQVSLEVEKPRPQIEVLFQGPQWIFFSKVYAQAKGFDDPMSLLHSVRPLTKGAGLICAWGAAGAYALDVDTRDYHSPGFAPAEIKDTLGAGDTFNAGAIDALVTGHGLAEAIRAGSELAGRKCGMVGFEDLR